MSEQTITLGSMPVYVAWPAAVPERAVIVLQEAFGVNEHIEDVARRFADEGYLACAPHIFHRSGGGTVPYGDMPAVIEHFKVLADDGVLADVDATLAWLRGEHIAAASTGIVGFCIGGRMSFLVAAHRRLGAAVGFYGGGIVKGRTELMPSLLPAIPEMQTPWLGLFGDQDQGIPVDEVEQLRAELKRAPAETEVVRYPEAGHGFHCDARPQAYHADAAADGWKRTLDWFGARLV